MPLMSRPRNLLHLQTLRSCNKNRTPCSQLDILVRMSMFMGGWPFVIAAMLVGLLMGMLCNTVAHMIMRIFRCIRCKAFGSSCSEYSSAGWAQVLIPEDVVPRACSVVDLEPFLGWKFCLEVFRRLLSVP